MKVRALMNFNAYGFLKQEGEEFEIEDRGVKADLEKIGFIIPVVDLKSNSAEIE